MSQDDDASDAQVQETYRRMRTPELPGPGIDARIRAAAVAAAEVRRADAEQATVGRIPAIAEAIAAPGIPRGTAGAKTRPRLSRRAAYFGWGGALAAGLALFAVVVPMGPPPALNDAAGYDPAAVAPAPGRSGEQAAGMAPATAAGSPEAVLNSSSAANSGDQPEQAVATRASPGAAEAAASTRAAMPPRVVAPVAPEVAVEAVAEANSASPTNNRIGARAGAEPGAASVEASELGRSKTAQDAPSAARLPLSSMAPPPPAVPPPAVPAETRLDDLPPLSDKPRDRGAAPAQTNGAAKVVDSSPARRAESTAAARATADTAKQYPADEVEAALVDLRRLYRAHDAALLDRLREFVMRYPDYPLRSTDPELSALLQR